MPQDAPTIHRWIQRPYAQRFWQLAGDEEGIEALYRQVLADPDFHSFVVELRGKSIAQIEAYAVSRDELALCVASQPEDTGFHLLMCPPREMKKGWSHAVLQLFLAFYFSHPGTKRLFAEPDERNRPANQLALQCGFQWQQKVGLSYKTANLFVLTREAYQAQQTSLNPVV